MKEIGIEKLIELLNEYVEETDFGDNLNEYNEADIIDGETLEVNGSYHDIEYLYTKQFGFIKWLVESDKIDLGNNMLGIEWSILDNYGYYNGLLMLLSISDTPIEDLISYLK